MNLKAVEINYAQRLRNLQDAYCDAHPGSAFVSIGYALAHAQNRLHCSVLNYDWTVELFLPRILVHLAHFAPESGDAAMSLPKVVLLLEEWNLLPLVNWFGPDILQFVAKAASATGCYLKGLSCQSAPCFVGLFEDTVHLLSLRREDVSRNLLQQLQGRPEAVIVVDVAIPARVNHLVVLSQATVDDLSRIAWRLQMGMLVEITGDTLLTSARSLNGRTSVGDVVTMCSSRFIRADSLRSTLPITRLVNDWCVIGELVARTLEVYDSLRCNRLACDQLILCHGSTVVAGICQLHGDEHGDALMVGSAVLVVDGRGIDRAARQSLLRTQQSFCILTVSGTIHGIGTIVSYGNLSWTPGVESDGFHGVILVHGNVVPAVSPQPETPYGYCDLLLVRLGHTARRSFFMSDPVMPPDGEQPPIAWRLIENQEEAEQTPLHSIRARTAVRRLRESRQSDSVAEKRIIRLRGSHGQLRVRQAAQESEAVRPAGAGDPPAQDPEETVPGAGEGDTVPAGERD